MSNPESSPTRSPACRTGRRRGDHDAARGAAGRPARDDRTPYPPAAGALPDRRLVLRRPLRPGPRRRHRRHERRAAPAHRAADRELAVHRRDRAPRQRRPPRDGAAGRGQPDDRRARDQPLRGLHARRPRRSTAPSSGWPSPTPTATPTPASSTTRRSRSTGPGWEARVFLGSLLGDTSPVTTHTPLLGAELLIDAGAVGDARRRPGLRARRARRLRGADGRRPSRRSRPSSPTCPLGRDRIELAAPAPSRCGCWCSAARRSASRS